MDKEISFETEKKEDSAISHNNIGVYYYSKGMYQEAIEEFKKALNINPGYIQARENLKAVNKQTGIYDRAIQAYKKVIQLYADDAEAHFNLGKALSYTGEYKEAIKELKETLRLKPEHLLAQNLLGVIYKNLGNYDEAEKVFREGLKKYPNYPELLNNLGEVLYKKGHYDEAIEYLERAVKLDKEYALAYYNLSFVYGEVGRDEEASMSYTRAVELNPAFVQMDKSLVIEHYDETKNIQREIKTDVEGRKEEAHFNLARVYKMKGYIDQSIKEIKRAITYNPKKPEYYNFFGELLIKKGLLNDAIKIFYQTLKLQPTFKEAKLNIVKAYRELKDFKKAWETLKEVENENPDYNKVVLEKGILLYKENKLDNAIEILKGYINTAPYDDEAHYYLGICYYQKGEYDSAIIEFRRALEILPPYIKRPEINLYLGLVLTDKGRYEEAIIEYQKVLSIQSKNAIAHNSLGVAYKNLGNIDKAIEEYKKAIEIDPKYYKAYNNLGVAYYKKNYFEEAKKYFKKAIEIMPEYKIARKNLEAAEKKDIVFKETIEKLKEKIKENVASPLYHYDLATAYRNAGHLNEAIVEYKKVIELDPDNIDAITNCGTTYLDLNDVDNAIKMFIMGIEKNSKDYKLHLFLADAYFKKEWWEESEIEYQKALKLNQEIVDPYFKLGEIYRYKGWWDEAIDMWQMYIERGNNDEWIRIAKENIRMIEVWKKELQLSPTSTKRKIIK